MSYDIYLKKPDVDNNLNYTSNVSFMWVDGDGNHISDLSGVKAKKAIPVLEKIVLNMTSNKSNFEKENPENGWGDFIGARNFVLEVLDMCVESPESTIYISR